MNSRLTLAIASPGDEAGVQAKSTHNAPPYRKYFMTFSRLFRTILDLFMPIV